MSHTSHSIAEPMSDRDFHQLSGVIHQMLGIKMPSSKKMMLQSRLMRRLRALGLSSYAEYCNHVLRTKGESEEVIHLLDLATTNKTSFFREAEHFQYMTEHALPALVKSPSRQKARHISFWSAACSTGQEPYTIAIVVSEFYRKHHLSDWTFSILATDISTRVLSKAKLGIYPVDEANSIPAPYRRGYLLRGKGDQHGTMRVAPALRRCVSFERMNLMAPPPRSGRLIDIIMCRNALIYFDREKQTHIVRNLHSRLAADGYVMLGMSESIHGYGLPLETVGRCVYQTTSKGFGHDR